MVTALGGKCRFARSVPVAVHLAGTDGVWRVRDAAGVIVDELPLKAGDWAVSDGRRAWIYPDPLSFTRAVDIVPWAPGAFVLRQHPHPRGRVGAHDFRCDRHGHPLAPCLAPSQVQAGLIQALAQPDDVTAHLADLDHPEILPFARAIAIAGDYQPEGGYWRPGAGTLEASAFACADAVSLHCMAAWLEAAAVPLPCGEDIRQVRERHLFDGRRLAFGRLEYVVCGTDAPRIWVRCPSSPGRHAA